jgi:tryptophan synthase alpha chain
VGLVRAVRTEVTDKFLPGPPEDSLRRPLKATRLDGALRRRATALVCYLPLGDPLVPENLAGVLVDAGADVLELGAPAAAPLLDGSVVAASMRRALANHTDHARAAGLAGALRENLADQAMVWMGYPETVDHGWAVDIAASGVDAALLADAPHHLDRPRRLLHEVGIELLPLLDLDMVASDVAVAVASTMGYVMVRAVVGKTGVRSDGPDPRLGDVLAALRHAGVRRPLAVGFGVRDARAAAHLAELGADAVVVGSAVLQAAIDGPALVFKLVSEIRKALDETGSP